MSRNTTTTTAPVTTATDTTVTAPDTDATDTTYVPDIASVVDAWRAGVMRRDAARSFITSHMTACIIAGDTAGAMVAATTMTTLDDAVRRPAERSFDVAPYVAATVARIVAMTDAAASLASGDTIPTDIPDAHVDAFRDAVRDAVAGITVDGNVDGTGIGHDAVRSTDHYVGARANADGYASNRVVGNADVSRHIAEIVAGRATDRAGNPITVTVGTFMTYPTIANAITSEYPVSVPRPAGAVAARFRRGGVVRTDNVCGFVYASHNNTHGARYVGTDDAA